MPKRSRLPGSTGTRDRHRQKSICPCSCRRVGKGHNAASSLVEIPWVRSYPSQPASLPATTRARRAPKAAAASRRVLHDSTALWAPERANGSNKRKPTEPPKAMPTHRPSLTSEPEASTLLFLVLSRLSFVASASVVFIKRASGPTCIFSSCLLLAFCNSPERSCYGDAGIFSLLDGQADRQSC